MKKILIIGGSAALLAALGLYWWEQYSVMSLFEFDLVNLDVKSFSGGNLNLSLKLKVVSKSKVEFTVSKVVVKIYVDGDYVGEATQEKEQVIPAMGYNFINIDLSVTADTLFRQVLDIAKNDPEKAIKIRTVGSCKVKSGFIPISLPFDETYDTNLGELLRATM